MKTANITRIAALTGIVLSLFAGSVQAQYKPTGDDGIAASPKLRARLDEHRPAPTPAEIPQMPCAKCVDKYSTRKDMTARGANKPTVLVVTHLCEGCGIDWAIKGFGRAKHSVATHTCTSCGAENLACCNTPNGGEVATKGMEKAKDFNIAPLK